MDFELETRMQKHDARFSLLALPLKISSFNPGLFCVCLALLFASSTSNAEIYKWVDANGQTHYSEKKKDADAAKAVQLKVKSEPVSAQEGSSPTQFRHEQESLAKQRQAQKQNERSSAPSEGTRPKSLSGGKSEDNDESRCNFARDIISGAIGHTSGRPTDKDDLDQAQNDVRVFCH
jgi:hypothetical protein